MTDIIVLIGTGSIGQAIARRVGAGKHVLLADQHRENADAAAKTLGDAGFEVSTETLDVSSRQRQRHATRVALRAVPVAREVERRGAGVAEVREQQRTERGRKRVSGTVAARARKR